MQGERTSDHLMRAAGARVCARRRVGRSPWAAPEPAALPARRRGLLAAALAAKGVDAEGCFELSVGNPDKGLMSLEEARRRVRQFVDARLPLVVTQVGRRPGRRPQALTGSLNRCFQHARSSSAHVARPCSRMERPGPPLRGFGVTSILLLCQHAVQRHRPAADEVVGAARGAPLQAPLFTLKSKLFADSTFVIGYDTAIRLIMPKYYGGEVPMLLELAAMRYRCARARARSALSCCRVSQGLPPGGLCIGTSGALPSCSSCTAPPP